MCLANLYSGDQDAVQLSDAPMVANVCSECSALCTENGEAPRIAALLQLAADLITRQHLMLVQAKLLPIQEFDRSKLS